MRLFVLFFVAIFIAGCSNSPKKLPILGNPKIQSKDTLYPTIRDFDFVNQDSIHISQKTFKDKIYVADFIFLSCPTICPVMNREMLKVYKTFENNPNILFISHTIDPKHDTIPRLKAYSENLGVDSKKWFFVTGDRDSIYSIAEESYFTAAYADSTEPGGYVHGGGFLLIDPKKHIRGVYDGTKVDETERLIRDIEILLKEIAEK